MMEGKPIKSRNKEHTWKKFKTIETKQEMAALEDI